jgi:hypothetical protein
MFLRRTESLGPKASSRLLSRERWPAYAHEGTYAFLAAFFFFVVHSGSCHGAFFFIKDSFARI